MPTWRFGRHSRVVLALVAASAVVGIALVLTPDPAGRVAAAAALAVLPLPLLVAGVLFLDRCEPEPPVLVAGMFAWGGTVALAGAFTTNSFASALFGDHGYAVATLVSAPVAEELLKGAGLVVLARFAARELDGPIDAVVYAAVLGLGFACGENVLYYASAGESLGLTVLVRGVFAPFAHPLFTAATALGLVAWRRTGRVRTAALGVSVAVGLHAAWNAMFVAADLTAVSGYFVVFLPLFVALVWRVVAVEATRERVALAGALAGDVAAGRVTAQAVELAVSMRARRNVLRQRCLTREQLRGLVSAAADLGYVRLRAQAGRPLPGDSQRARSHVRKLSADVDVVGHL